MKFIELTIVCLKFEIKSVTVGGAWEDILRDIEQISSGDAKC